jgi:uncharacterized membrane protein
MRYVLLFIIYLIVLSLTYKKLTREEDIVSILIGALAIHLSIAFIGLIIFIFYYFW